MSRFVVYIFIFLTFTYPSSLLAECRILVFGDSLVAGYGLARKDSFTETLQQSLIDKNHNVTVINGGVSGDTTSSALNRLNWALFDKPGLMIVVIGANDMLRGLPNQNTKNNLTKIITTIKQNNIPVMLAGMRASLNMGEEYIKEFNNIYPTLAEKMDVALYPFFLDGVALQKHLNQRDGIHPNADGTREIVVRITPHVEKMLPSCIQEF